MYNHPSRLVDHNAVAILIHNRQRHLYRLDRCQAVRNPDYTNDVSGDKLVTWLDTLPIDCDIPCPDPALYERTGGAVHLASNIPIQALAAAHVCQICL
jgi:hypothetical protein